jgi:hypothetical protein
MTLTARASSLDAFANVAPLVREHHVVVAVEEMVICSTSIMDKLCETRELAKRREHHGFESSCNEL